MTRAAPPFDRAALARALPQRAPFCFVDVVVRLDADGGAFALELSPGDPRLGPAGRLSPLLLIEALAQSTAAYHGLVQGRGAAREAGMLVQIDSAELLEAAAPGRVDLVIVRKHALGNLGRFAGEARGTDRVLVRCDLTVARGHAP